MHTRGHSLTLKDAVGHTVSYAKKSSYIYKPDLSIKMSPRIDKSTLRLVNEVCEVHEMNSAEVLRFCVEAAVPEAARRGMKWLISLIPNFDRIGEETYSSMVTMRTSARVKSKLGLLVARDHDEAEILRYCILAMLPIALRDGMAPIMTMREKNIRERT